MSETLILHDALRFAGFLLAKQAGTAAAGEIPTLLAVVSSDPEDPPTLIKPTTDSESPERQIAAGKIVLDDQKGRFRTWALSFDEELEPFRILMLEVGCKGMVDFCFVQRYVYPENGKFQLVGQVDLLTRETLDPTVARELEACVWRELMEEGAEMNAEFGEQWPQWRAAMRSTDQGQRYAVGEYGYVCPSGWVPSKTEEGDGWMFYRLVPWAHRGNEPAIICNQVTWDGQPTVEAVVERLATPNPKGDREILESEVFELEAGLLVGRVLAQLAADNSLIEQNIVPTDENGQFLMISAVSQNEFWTETERARDVVLGSLDWREGRQERKGFGATIRDLMRRFLV